MLERALALAAVVSILLGGALLLKGDEGATRVDDPAPAPADPPREAPPAEPPRDAPPRGDPPRESPPERPPPAPPQRRGLPLLGPILG